MRFFSFVASVFTACAAFGQLAASEIQDRLDKYEYCDLSQRDDAGRVVPGVHVLDATITVNSRQCLVGPATIQCADGVDWAIRLGDPAKTIYDAKIADLRIVKGGVHLARIGQNCIVRDVTVSRAPHAAFLLDGVGDGLMLDHCIGRESGEGIRVNARVSHNALTVSHCNFQHNRGPGVIIETFIGGGLYSATFADCVIQSNNVEKVEPAEFVLRGWVGNMCISHCWIEGVTSTIGVCAERWQQPQPNGGTIAMRIPQGLSMPGTTVGLLPIAVRWDGGKDRNGAGPDLTGLNPTVGVVEYRARANSPLPRTAPGTILRTY